MIGIGIAFIFVTGLTFLITHYKIDQKQPVKTGIFILACDSLSTASYA